MRSFVISVVLAVAVAACSSGADRVETTSVPTTAAVDASASSTFSVSQPGSSALPIAAGGLIDGPRFELLDLQPSFGEIIGRIQLAGSDDELVSIWLGVQIQGARPEVNFDQWVVLVFTVPDDACPPVLAGFEIGDDDVMTPVLLEVVASCRQPLSPKTLVVAIARADLPESFVVQYPAFSESNFVDEDGFARAAFTDVHAGIDVESPDVRLGRTEQTGSRLEPPSNPVELRYLSPGEPVWIVQHGDRTRSVLAAFDESPSVVGANVGLVTPVTWSRSGNVFVADQLVWDPWGRALTSGAEFDLRSLGVTFTDDVASVVPVGRGPVDEIGEVEFDGGDPMWIDETSAEFDDVVAGSLEPGWYRLENTQLQANGAGVVRMCERVVPGGVNQRCPDDAFVVEQVTFDFQNVRRLREPILVEVDEDGDIVTVAPAGGMAGG